VQLTKVSLRPGSNIKTKRFEFTLGRRRFMK